MFIINDTYTYNYEINKSKFIGLIFKVYSTVEFNKKLDEIKDEYPKATHYCYAYRLIDTYKMSDDGEPSSTAGAPIYNVIEANDLYNTAIVVVRYFGGIKLGAGGLVRAYSKTSANLIEKNRLNKLVESYQIEIQFSYENMKLLDNILANCNMEFITKEFDSIVHYLINISKEDLPKLNNFTYEITKDTMIDINA